MSTGVTANPVAIEFFVEITLTNVLVDNVAESGHGNENLCHYFKPAGERD